MTENLKLSPHANAINLGVLKKARYIYKSVRYMLKCKIKPFGNGNTVTGPMLDLLFSQRCGSATAVLVSDFQSYFVLPPCL